MLFLISHESWRIRFLPEQKSVKARFCISWHWSFAEHHSFNAHLYGPFARYDLFPLSVRWWPSQSSVAASESLMWFIVVLVLSFANISHALLFFLSSHFAYFHQDPHHFMDLILLHLKINGFSASSDCIEVHWCFNNISTYSQIYHTDFLQNPSTQAWQLSIKCL